MTRTRKLLCAVSFGVASWVATGPALADQPKSDDVSKSMSAMEKKSMQATVVRVDTAKRHIVLQGDNGLEFTAAVPESVKRLDEIKPGDKIKVDYYESIALSLEKPGEGAAPSASTRTLTERTGGKLPGGAIAHQESGTVEIVKVNRSTHQITVKRPSGEMDTIDVKDPELQSHLATLKEGDKIHANYTEAAVISVERQKSERPQAPNKSM